MLLLYVFIIFFIVIISNIKKIEKFTNQNTNKTNIFIPFDQSIVAIENEFKNINIKPLIDSSISFDKLLKHIQIHLRKHYERLDNVNKELYKSLIIGTESNLSEFSRNLSSFKIMPFINIINIYGKAIFEDIPNYINSLFDNINNRLDDNTANIEALQKQINELKNINNNSTI